MVGPRTPQALPQLHHWGWHSNSDVTTSQIPVDDHDATSVPNVFVIGNAVLVSCYVTSFVSNAKCLILVLRVQ